MKSQSSEIGRQEGTLAGCRGWQRGAWGTSDVCGPAPPFRNKATAADELGLTSLVSGTCLWFAWLFLLLLNLSEEVGQNRSENSEGVMSFICSMLSLSSDV